MHPARHSSPFLGYRPSSPASEVQDRPGRRHLNSEATPSSIPMTLSPALTSIGMDQPKSPQHLPFKFFPPPSKADPPTPQRPSGCATSCDQPPCQRCYQSAHRTRHWPNLGEDGQRGRNTQAQKKHGSALPRVPVCDVAAGETTYPTILYERVSQSRGR